MLSLLKIRLSDTIDQVEEQFVVFSLLNLIKHQVNSTLRIIMSIFKVI